ncbi:MAG TPA: MotA/TolQ/ExbB proton channel family protein [Candidatus Hydrogenedentes bacterium]|nr:MotA/TolQ/ExbB proton channel family protein [Candidatus Hydrogenedentota bacterium]HOV72592.1 MotA/TolQ/ExbB proton channel family protein [Candidatus Hydrogenedentota bacterium]HPC17954.1 MotA/TolQ/ExbB proton channel family protein [Candidatus Hydrogenedentota bacterium]HRT21823.1 MotA/TolQ/ExbB proton channel family protein [Candidatus Hydrogenedentota bacterium]HRT63281.1 MotA/TolQ/ExbB proton channel family protein [Candidatus Hydrogenedentota bacterium]
MELITFAVKHDWAVLLPIIFCSVLVLSVAVERFVFYRRNRRDVVQFINRLERDLQRNNLNSALNLSCELGGLLGEVSEEGIRTLAEQKSSFERLFDITANLATRKLERNLSILGTIATISPYLGLFGTVVRILLTFGEMAKGGGGGGAPMIMFGIGSALIATAFGLGVAILAVGLNNYFHTIVGRWEEDFQLLKLLFLSVADRRPAASAAPAAAQPYRRPAEI